LSVFIQLQRLFATHWRVPFVLSKDRVCSI
jgi:hypothetical protein